MAWSKDNSVAAKLAAAEALAQAQRAELGADYIDEKQPLIDEFIGEQTNLQTQLNDLVLQSGTDIAEVVQARGGFATVNDRLADTTAQLAETGKQLTSVNKNVWTTSRGSWSPKAMISFTDDDGDKTQITQLAPIFTSRNAPVTLAVYSGSEIITNEAFRTQLLDLQNNYNFEIASHHLNHSYMTTLTEKQLREESAAILKLLSGYGFVTESIVYPYGDQNALVRSVMKEYYRAGLNSANGSGASNSYNNADIYNLTRAQFGYDNTKTFADYKAIVDTAVANKGWLIFISHSHEAQFDDNQRVILGQLIDYIKSINVDIVTLRDGLNYFEPISTSGEFSTTAYQDYFRLLKSGKVLSNSAINFLKQNAHPASATISAYENPLTIFSVDSTYGQANGYPSQYAGTIMTIKGSVGKGYHYQLYMNYYKTEIWVRRSTSNADETWTTWSKLMFEADVDAKLTYKVNSGYNQYTAAQLITDYPDKAVTTFYVDGGGSTGFPKGSAGLVTTFRLNGNGYSRQEFREYLSNSVYTRYVHTDGTWLNWKRISANLALTTAERTSLSAIGLSAGDSVFDTTLNKPIWRNAANNGWVDAGRYVAVPASATAVGIPGDWAADASYMYVCHATNTWKRVAIATW